MSLETDLEAFDRILGTDAVRPVTQGLDHHNAEWIRAAGVDLDRLVRVERVKRYHSERWAKLLEAVVDDHDRRILAGVYQNGGSATYDDLDEWSALSRRRQRDRVTALTEADILATDRSRFVVVTWADETMEVLAPDALSTYLGRG